MVESLLWCKVFPTWETRVFCVGCSRHPVSPEKKIHYCLPGDSLQQSFLSLKETMQFSVSSLVLHILVDLPAKRNFWGYTAVFPLYTSLSVSVKPGNTVIHTLALVLWKKKRNINAFSFIKIGESNFLLAWKANWKLYWQKQWILLKPFSVLKLWQNNYAIHIEKLLIVLTGSGFLSKK